MPVVKVKWNGKRVRLEGFGPNKYLMFQLGNVAVASIKERVSRGIGSYDAPMKPLSSKTSVIRTKNTKKFVKQRSGYAEWKARHGGQPIRDLRGPDSTNVGGHMLDWLRVNYASDTRCTIDVTSRLARIKARANERRASWYGFSKQDMQKITIAGAMIFKQTVREIGANFSPNGRYLTWRAPVWMDPASFIRRAAA